MYRLHSITTPLLILTACACLAAGPTTAPTLAPTGAPSLLPSVAPPVAPSVSPTGTPATARIPVTAPAPATMPTVSKEMQGAIDRLTDDDANTREAAQDQLVQMGPIAIDPLKQLIAATTDIEQRTGAQAAIMRIEEMAMTGPTIITMKMENVTAEQIVAEFTRQAKVMGKSSDGEADDVSGGKKYSINIDHQLYWTAARQICKATGLKINLHGGNSPIGFSRGGMDLPGPYFIDGPFMIVATTLSTNTDIELAHPGNINRNQNIQFVCFAEPKLQIGQRPNSVKLVEATDDTGKSLVAADTEGMYSGFTDGNQGYWDANAMLNTPEPAAKKIVRLRGQLQVVATTKTETLEIPDLLKAKNVTRTAGGQSITVNSVNVRGDEVTVNLSILASNMNDGGYQMMQSVRLVDAEGHYLQNNGVGGGGGMNGRLQFRLNFNRRSSVDGKDVVLQADKLVLPVPTETKVMDCNFEMKDLPLK